MLKLEKVPGRTLFPPPVAPPYLCVGMSAFISGNGSIAEKEWAMNNIFWLIGVIVVILAILSFLRLR